jgi:hypothetical protein
MFDIIPSDFDTDVEADVQDIMIFKKKRIGGRRIPTNIPPAIMDNISFQEELHKNESLISK